MFCVPYPMITILHGDNQVASRQRLTAFKDEAKSQGKEIITLEGKGIDKTLLIQSFESGSLFSLPKLVVIENLIGSLRTGSKIKDEIIEYLITGKFDSDVIVWEGKSVGKSLLKLKKQKHVKVEDFKMPVVIFKLVESLTPTTVNEALFYLDETLKTTPVEVAFTMIVRQFRILLGLATNAPLEEIQKMAPWSRGKTTRQTAFFSPEKLKVLYKQLLIIDYQTKTGRTPFDLTKATQQFIISLASV